MTKRIFDIVGAACSLVLLSPIFVAAALLVKLGSHGPIFFKQQRIGRGFKPFLIYKFRTMAQDPENTRLRLTVGDDPRITKVGRFLRKTKIDELPQLINVLKGDMSLVGPRPEIPEFVQLFKSDYEQILRMRPGITDPASLKYRDEATILGQSENPEDDYLRHILPEKIKLAKEYMKQSSFFFDVVLIFKTLLKLFEYRTSSQNV